MTVVTERGLTTHTTFIVLGIHMAKKDKASLPQSTAGLVRYFDDYHESITIKPETIVFVIVAIIVLRILYNIVY